MVRVAQWDSAVNLNRKVPSKNLMTDHWDPTPFRDLGNLWVNLSQRNG